MIGQKKFDKSINSLTNYSEIARFELFFKLALKSQSKKKIVQTLFHTAESFFITWTLWFLKPFAIAHPIHTFYRINFNAKTVLQHHNT